jgi:hypothetical protein
MRQTVPSPSKKEEQMTNVEWLQLVDKNIGVLREFVAQWHPSTTQHKVEHEHVEVLGEQVEIDKIYPITAPGAEHARRTVEGHIRKEKINPIEAFEKAYAARNVSAIGIILNDTWFGVPESTSCWSIKGFAEAVELLEQPPDDEEEPEVIH